MFGRLVSISADAFEDERTGLTYYEAEVEIDCAVLEAAAPDLWLTPGMPAEVYVATEERTVLAYLVDTLRQTVERAFREQRAVPFQSSRSPGGAFPLLAA